MKKVLTLLILAIVAFVIGGTVWGSRDKEKRMEASRFAFESGCYHFSRQFCPTLGEPGTIDDCYNKALEACPQGAVDFKNWLSQGQK